MALSQQSQQGEADGEAAPPDAWDEAEEDVLVARVKSGAKLQVHLMPPSDSSHLS
jgi:hypothetical protein